MEPLDVGGRADLRALVLLAVPGIAGHQTSSGRERIASRTPGEQVEAHQKPDPGVLGGLT